MGQRGKRDLNPSYGQFLWFKLAYSLWKVTYLHVCGIKYYDKKEISLKLLDHALYELTATKEKIFVRFQIYVDLECVTSVGIVHPHLNGLLITSVYKMI